MKKQLIVILLFFILFPNFSFSQLIYPKLDGLYRLTYHYVPEKWKLYNFNLNPFSPVYSTEVSVPDTSYIKIEIKKHLDKGNKEIIVNSTLANDSRPYFPAIYNLNWVNTTDNHLLPVTDGHYTLNLSAYKDSLLTKLMYSDSISFLVLNGWQDISSKIAKNYFKYLPGYTVYKDKEIKLWNKDEEKIINWVLLGARIKSISDTLSKDYILKLSIKFKPNEYGNAFTSLYSAYKSGNKLSSYKIKKKLGFYKLKIIDVTIRKGEMEYLIIDNLGSNLTIMNIKELWQNMIK